MGSRTVLVPTLRDAALRAAPQGEVGGHKRSSPLLGLRLRLADVEPGLRHARDSRRAPAGMAPRLLHLFGALSRHAQAARSDPRPAAGRLLPRARPSPA